LAGSKNKKSINSIKTVLFLLIITVFFLHYLFTVYIPERNRSGGSGIPDGSARFCFYYVGQGDAAVISTPAGRIMIDTGPNSSEKELISSMKADGIDKLDMLFITHTDEDHAGGADGIIRSFEISSVYMPPVKSSSGVYDAIERAASQKSVRICECMSGDGFLLGPLSIRIISPFYPLSSDVNEDSLVMILTVGNTSALFCADAGTETERAVLKKYALMPSSKIKDSGGGLSSAAGASGDIKETRLLPFCQLIKVGHHGSSTSTSAEWLEAFSPSYAVISCGKGNSFGHPHPAVLKRLKAAGVEVYRTDLCGKLVFMTDGASFSLIGNGYQ